MTSLRKLRLAGHVSFGLFALQALGSAQSYQFANAQLPSGNPFNNSATENVDFADVDLDGDMDCANADGGDGGNDQNRLWMNMGFLQGGTLGFFQDQTATRFPAVLDDSRDMDFVDVDLDGDEDLYVSNTAQLSPNTNRFWINMGGLQGGTSGFYQDQTSTRWLNLGVNNGSTECSSIPPGFVFGTGGFQDWSCDCVFGDLDNDGDVDLLHSTYGGAFGGDTPQRIFLNDGAGHFKEYNPSCYQLTTNAIPNGAPALWAQGVQQDGTTNATGAFADVDNTPLGVELGDIDADYDIDFLIGSRNNPPPRLFRNMKKESGLLIWRDVTYGQMAEVATGGDNYEQEFGDMEPDGDYDIYGLNWPGLSDAVYPNDGAGNFGVATVLDGSGADDNEGDFIDYNNDGRMDIFVGNFSGQDRLYRGDGAGGFSHVTSTELPPEGNTTLGCDGCDIDKDGDYDIIDANDGGQANTLYKNVNQIADTKAALLPHLEPAPNRLASALPTAVRVHVYDNCSWDVLRYNDTLLQYQVNGGAFTDAPMMYVGGQLFRGEIPGTLVGTIGYRVRTTDEHGNVGLSALKTYDAQSGSCTGSISTYCTALVSSSGCVPAMGSSGTPNLSSPDGFQVRGVALEASQNGLMFFGTTGQASTPFFGGTLCVNVPLHRMAVKNSGAGAACTGLISYTLGEMLAQPTGGPLLLAGVTVDCQVWFRDPPSAQTVGLTNGLELTVCP
jgi:hypothetical protein